MKIMVELEIDEKEFEDKMINYYVEKDEMRFEFERNPKEFLEIYFYDLIEDCDLIARVKEVIR